MVGMRQDLYSNECISAENQSTEINLKSYRGEVFLIVLLKTVFENLDQLKSYDQTNPNVFVFGLWGLHFFWSVYMVSAQ